MLVALAATQDIAVDGWALTILSKPNRSYASTCQTIGLNAGFFLAFTIFLALNSPDFCNSYLRSVPADVGLVGLGEFMRFWSVVYVLLTAWLMFFQREAPFRPKSAHSMSIAAVYRTIWTVIKKTRMLFDSLTDH